MLEFESVLQDRCRICLEILATNQKLSSLWDNNLNVYILECLTIKMEDLVIYPDKVCLTCTKHLHDYYILRKRSQLVETLLKRLTNREFQTHQQFLEEIQSLTNECRNTAPLPESIKNELKPDVKFDEKAFSDDDFNDDTLSDDLPLKIVFKRTAVVKRIKKSNGNKISRIGKPRKRNPEESEVTAGVENNDISKNDSDFDDEKKTPFIDDLPKDITQIYDERENHCKLCGKTNTRFSALKEHLMSVHGIPYDAIPRRARVHANVGEFKCIAAKCSAEMRNMNQFVVHMRNHHKTIEQKYPCSFCDAKFYIEKQVNMHVRRYHFTTINDDDDYNCPIAGDLNCVNVTFKTISHVGRHLIDVHQMTRPDVKKMCADLITNGPRKETLCQICGSSETNLPRHMKKQHRLTKDGKVIMFACKFCCDKFETRKQLAAHTKKKHRKNKICHYCGIMYSKPSHLASHLDEIDPVTGKSNVKKEVDDDAESMAKRTCSYCNKVFSTTHVMKIHIKRLHKPIQCVSCPHCSRPFRPHTLARHIKYYHLNVNSFACSVCGKRFMVKYHLTQHLRRHTDERPYTCRFCPQSFRQIRVMRHHEMRHTGEKPHACTVCDKRFIQKVALTTHLKTHSGQRDYLCSFCQKAFTQSSALNAHIKMHHYVNVKNENSAG